MSRRVLVFALIVCLFVGVISGLLLWGFDDGDGDVIYTVHVVPTEPDEDDRVVAHEELTDAQQTEFANAKGTRLEFVDESPALRGKANMIVEDESDHYRIILDRHH